LAAVLNISSAVILFYGMEDHRHLPITHPLKTMENWH